MRAIAARVSAALLFLFCATALHAQQMQSTALTAIPRLVRVTSVFVPANGLPAAPVEIVTFAIYAEEKGGSPLWQETQSVVVGADGRYTILLGATQSDGLPLELFASGEARWLGRRFERPGEGEQTRVLLASVPYALKASDADTIGGRPATDFLLSPQGQTRTNAGTGQIAGAATPGNLITPASLGTPGRIGKFFNSTDLGDSVMFESAGMIGLGTTAPLDNFHVQFTNTTGAFTGYAVQNMGNTATSYSGMLFYDQNGALGQFQGFNNVTHEYRINNIASGGSINFMIGSSSKFLVSNSGRVGIGTATPAVPLDVVGSAVVSAAGTTSYFLAGDTTLTVASNTSWATSIRASSGIVAGAGYLTASDKRIKNIQGRSDSTADLGKLLGIEVTDFLYKDVVEKGSGPQKKVIAQQVEEVYPQAVRSTTDVVPDIFQKASINNGWIELATDLRVGDRVRLITENGHPAVHEVLEVKRDRFRTDFAENAGQVFVYGREVNDFRVVDYESIAVLNVSATQELNRRLEQLAGSLAAQTARITELEQERQRQTTRIVDLEKQASEIATLRQQMAELQAVAGTSGGSNRRE